MRTMPDGVLLKVVNRNGETEIDTIVVNFDKSKSRLDQMYELIGCELVDRAVMTIDDTTYSCWVDDEGILNGKEPVIMIPPYGQTLYGNVLITVLDDQGNIRPMTKHELIVLNRAL